MDQYSAIQALLLKHTGSAGILNPLAGDASSREYFRAGLPGSPCIVCRDRAFSNYTGEKYPFIAVNRDLAAAGIPVPGIIAADKEQGLFLIQDLGDELLQLVYPSLASDRVISLYRRIIDIMIRIQSIKGSGRHFSLCFNTYRLMYEFNFFTVHAMMCYFGSGITQKDLRKLNGLFLNIAEELDSPGNFVLNHRDLHSRNIIIQEGMPWIIDFQDARMGLPQYDLVSLLYDSYVVLEPGVRQGLVQYYYDAARNSGIVKMSRDQFDYYLSLMAFQRNIKAVGTFGYQCSCAGNMEYEKYIGQTLGYVRGYADSSRFVAGAVEIISRYLDLEGLSGPG